MSIDKNQPIQTPSQSSAEKRQRAVPNAVPQNRAEAIEQLREHLRKRYLLLLLPPGLLLAGLETARALGSFTSLPFVDHQTWDITLFVLAAFFAVALPLLYRVIFANAHRGKAAVAFGAFYRFENNSMVAALFSVWIAVGASLIAVTGYHMAGIFLLTLYACYVFYPSRRRLTSDAKVFRAGFSDTKKMDPASRKADPEASELE